MRWSFFAHGGYPDPCRLWLCVGRSLLMGTIYTPADSRSVIVQELCESRGGRPELSVLMSLLVSVDVKNY